MAHEKQGRQSFNKEDYFLMLDEMFATSQSRLPADAGGSPLISRLRKAMRQPKLKLPLLPPL